MWQSDDAVESVSASSDGWVIILPGLLIVSTWNPLVWSGLIKQMNSYWENQGLTCKLDSLMGTWVSCLYQQIFNSISSVSGQCVFITCQLYEYHFIKEEMSWDEARAYCRENYTDLAKVFDLTDMRRLQDSAQNQTEAWIGLYSKPGDNRTWHWSLPGEEYTENKTCWGGTEPDDGAYPENCVMTSMAWIDFPCTHTFQFICYNGENMWTVIW